MLWATHDLVAVPDSDRLKASATLWTSPIAPPKINLYNQPVEEYQLQLLPIDSYGVVYVVRRPCVIVNPDFEGFHRLEKKGRGDKNGVGLQEMKDINRLTTIWMTMAIVGIQITSRLPSSLHPILQNLAENMAWRAIKPWGVG